MSSDLTSLFFCDLIVNDDIGCDSDLTAPPDRVILGLEEDMTMNDHKVTDKQKALFNAS
jgi:hypothetical protein